MKIAILGGTFDPIHKGHLAAAHAVAKTFDIDEVHFIPAFSPPHKPSSKITSPFHRSAMIALATSKIVRFTLSTIEMDLLEPSYSVDTLKLMHQQYPNSRFIFIAGTDMYKEIDSWERYQQLFRLTSFAIVNRPGFPMRNDVSNVELIKQGSKACMGAQPAVYYLPSVDCDISSTRIREELKRGGHTSNWLEPAVRDYIDKHRLYGLGDF